MAQRTQYYDAVFLIFDPDALRQTKHSKVMLHDDPQRLWSATSESPEYLIGFLEKILNPLHLDKNTLDDFRDLVANYVFSYYLHDRARHPTYFEDYVDWFESLRIKHRHPKTCNILRIFYRYLKRQKPNKCPKLDLLRDEYVDYEMVWDRLSVIQFRFIESEGRFTVKTLPNLYKLMGSNAEATFAVWDKARDRWTESTEWIALTAELVSRKMGLEQRWNDGLSDELLIRKVTAIKARMKRIWYNSLRADVFSTYWESLYELKQSGFSGSIAIVNRDYILTDSWTQSLLRIFGTNNTVVERAMTRSLLRKT